MKNEVKQKVKKFLSDHKIEWLDNETVIAVNRDSMCNSQFVDDKIPEEGAYENILTALNKALPNEGGRFVWDMKNDVWAFMNMIVTK